MITKYNNVNKAIDILLADNIGSAQIILRSKAKLETVDMSQFELGVLNAEFEIPDDDLIELVCGGEDREVPISDQANKFLDFIFENL